MAAWPVDNGLLRPESLRRDLMGANARNALDAMHERFGVIRWLFGREREELSSFPEIVERVNEAEAAVDRVRGRIDRVLAAADNENDRPLVDPGAMPVLLNLN